MQRGMTIMHGAAFADQKCINTGPRFEFSSSAAKFSALASKT